jgi:hypothetical protein
VRVEIPYKPRPLQQEVHDLRERHRFMVLVCHRRFGKTVLGVNELQKSALTAALQRPRTAYIGPTYRQAKSVAWDYCQYYARPIPGITVNQSELRIDYPTGGQMRLYGSDNPDALRGLYLDDVAFDEYGLHPAKTYTEVIAPALVDRGGRALFLGTPNGKNQFWEIAQHAKAREAAGDKDWCYREYRASETGILDAAYLAQAKAVMTPDEYAQEFECSFEAAVKGAIFAKELEAAREQGRITRVPYDPSLPADTDWDLGIGDAMAIWFSQSTRSGEVRLIDYHEASGEGFPHYARVLRDKGYSYGRHWAPHDIQVRELGSGRSRLEVAAEHGIRFEVTPRLHSTVAGEVEEGIHAARMLFARCWFDAEKTKAGVEALMHYRRDYNERLQEFKAVPVHDWACFTPDTEVLTRFGTCQIMSLPENGEVLTPCGWKRYEGPKVTRRDARLVEVRFSDGHTVRCTPDHLFATESGWRSAECLTPGLPIRSCLTHSASTSTGTSIVSGLRSATSRVGAHVYTAMCGWLRSVRSLTDATSITAMETAPTIAFPTLSVLPAVSISRRSGNGATQARPFTSLPVLATQPPNGTALRQEGPGTDGTLDAARDGRSGSARIVRAFIAARSFTMRLFGSRGTRRSTARRRARPLHIASVRPLDVTADTCCIHVPDVECFALANGAVVHNSHAADAFRGLAVRHQTPVERKRVKGPGMSQAWAWS